MIFFAATFYGDIFMMIKEEKVFKNRNYIW